MSTTRNTPNWRTAPHQMANGWRRNANHVNKTTRRTNEPRHTAIRRRKQRRMTTKRQQRTYAPIAKKTNAGSPVMSTQTYACGTKNTKDTGSNPSAMSSRWPSSHATHLRQKWAGTQKRRIRRANDGARGQRILRGRMIMTDGSRFYRRPVINTK